MTEDRAAYAAGRIAADMTDKSLRTQGLDLLRVLAESGRRNDFVYRAMITGGLRLVKTGRARDGTRLLERVPKQMEGYYALAQMHLAEIDREREKCR